MKIQKPTIKRIGAHQIKNVQSILLLCDWSSTFSTLGLLVVASKAVAASISLLWNVGFDSSALSGPAVLLTAITSFCLMVSFVMSLFWMRAMSALTSTACGLPP